MKKQEAIKLLGDDIAKAARNLGVSQQAINKWPDVLPARI
jgi:transposase-like protein